VLLTHNTKDFPARQLAALGLRVSDPDTYLCELADERPDEIDITLIRLAGEKTNPHKSPTDLLDDLAHAGVKRFVAVVRPRLAEP
jgi:hypothetical protein